MIKRYTKLLYLCTSSEALIYHGQKPHRECSFEEPFQSSTVSKSKKNSPKKRFQGAPTDIVATDIVASGRVLPSKSPFQWQPKRRTKRESYSNSRQRHSCTLSHFSSSKYHTQTKGTIESHCRYRVSCCVGFRLPQAQNQRD